MEKSIRENIEHPEKLEELYLSNKTEFKNSFNIVYPKLIDHKLAEFWNIRLNTNRKAKDNSYKINIPLLLILSFITGTLAKLPYILDIDIEPYFAKNIGYIIFPVLIIFFIIKNKLSLKKSTFIIGVLILSWVLISQIIMVNKSSDTYILTGIHLPLFLWSLLGFTFIAKDYKSFTNRINFLRFNGEILILTILILILGGILTGLTIGLFSLTGMDITEFYMKWIVVYGITAAPVVSTFIVQSNPQLVDKVSSMLAKIFSPLVLVTLLIYLASSAMSNKDPFTDREYLIIFNLILISVMAIIFFAVSENSKSDISKPNSITLFLLSVVTIIVNSIALSAIIFRISEWGFTPNRLVVLGSNILILVNLTMVSYNLLFSTFKSKSNLKVVKSIAKFLPIYSLWTIIVVFVLPYIFNFK